MTRLICLYFFLFQLYELDDTSERKVFLDDLFTFMQSRGESINRIIITPMYSIKRSNVIIMYDAWHDACEKKLSSNIMEFVL